MNTEENNPRKGGASARKLVAKSGPLTPAEIEAFKKSQRLPALKTLGVATARALPSPAHECDLGNFYHL